MTVERHLQRRFLRKRGAAGIPPQSLLRKASSPKGTPYGNAGNFVATAKSRPLGEGGLTRSGKTEGVIPLYDRIMNLYKHFCKGLDSRAKTVIMVLALRNKEC